MKTIQFLIYLFVSLHCSVWGNYSPALLTSTEADPDSFIEHCVNVMTGDYCESVTDLTIIGPDALSLQRFFNTKNYITGKDAGGWRIFPQQFLVLGRDAFNAPDEENIDYIYAFAGERSGGILTYSGWTKNGLTEDPLLIDVFHDAIGMVNTYAKDISGQTNHKNNQLHCRGETCEMTLGDGSKRIYKKVNQLPTKLLGEELVPCLANQVKDPEYYHLIQETLPSGNILIFTYDSENHLANVEMKNGSLEKQISWLNFTYELLPKGYLVKILTSDERTLEYHFTPYVLANGVSFNALTEVKGSHHIPCTYKYQVKDNLCLLKEKSFSPTRFIQADYDEYNRVFLLKEPHLNTGEPVISFSFEYEKEKTIIKNALGIKTNYKFDNRFQLTSIEKFDSKNNLVRVDQKFWGTKPNNVDQLMAKTVSDSNVIRSYYCFKYDSQGNISEKQLYGNLSGKEKGSLRLNAENQLIDAEKLECHKTTYTYSKDGFNLLISIGSTSNQTTFLYKTGTNLCERELVANNFVITKRLFRTYNEDAVCIQIIEDDGSKKDENDISDICERHITNISPKNILPGVGLPEIHEKMAYDPINKTILLESKHINTFDTQGNLIVCETHDANDKFAYKEEKHFLKGLLSSETNPLGHVTTYIYDDYGNRKTITNSSDNKISQYDYNFRNQPTIVLEEVGEFKLITENKYDDWGRKIATVDYFGNTTHYSYDDFGRLSKVVFPPVYDEYEKINQPTFTYEYDIFGNVIREEDPRGFVTQKTYTLRGQPTRIDYPDGSAEIFIYHLRGDLYRTLSRENIYTYYEYDDQGRVIVKKSLGDGGDRPNMVVDLKKLKYKGFRCIESQDDKEITKYEFDPFGRPVVLTACAEKNISKDSRQATLSYNSLGLVSDKKTWFDYGENDYSLDHFEYDLAGNVLYKCTKDHNEKVLIEEGFKYDANGRCEEEFEILNGQHILISKSSYNPLGELTSCTDEAGNVTKIYLDYSHYNNFGQKVLKKTIVNPLGTQTEIEFDALGRMVRLLKRNLEGELLSNLYILYDAVGNKCFEIHDQISEGKKLGTQIFRWVYGPMGRVDEESEFFDGIEKSKIKYIYNHLGQLISKTVPGFDQPLTFTYDPTGKVKFAKFADEKLPEHQQILNKYLYNTKGKVVLASHKTNGNCIKREFNIFEQMTSESIEMDYNRYKINYSYDRKGRIKSIILPDGSSIQYTYDALFCREIKRLSKEGKVLYSHIYSEYDNRGRLTNEVLIGNIGNREYKYKNNLLSEINISKINIHENGKYDSLGRLIKIEKQKADNFINIEYNYNELSQIISEKGLKDNTYKYDSLDNKTSENNNSLVYNSLNQLQSVANKNFSYDLQGNLIKKTVDNTSTNFESNILSEILKIEKPDNTKLSFLHDALGRRFVKKHLGTQGKLEKILSKEFYLYLGDQEIGIFDENRKIQQLRVPGISGDNLSLKSVCIELADKFYASVHGIDGNLIALVDPSSSSIVESYTYSAFGQETIYDALGNPSKISILGNPWRYAEKRIDKETGLVFFGRRYYDPEIGRWITPDPIGTKDGANAYAYLHNNPPNFFDRFGLKGEKNTIIKSEHYIYDDTYYIYDSWGDPADPHVLSGSVKIKVCKQANDLPKITYNDNFENMHTHYESEEDFREKASTHDFHFRPYYERSKVYDLNKPDSPDIGIGFINGMNNTYKEAYESTEYISRIAGGRNVHAVYNATHGFTNDLCECKMGLNYIATEPVRQLHKMWNDYFSKSSSQAKFLMICHSQGAIHVRNALLDYPEHLRSRILVVAIAPGGYVYKQSCAQAIHYRAEADRDFVPRFDKEGAKRSKDTIVTLKSHPSANSFDHNFTSPTYEPRLQQHIGNYIKSQGKIL